MRDGELDWVEPTLKSATITEVHILDFLIKNCVMLLIVSIYEHPCLLICSAYVFDFRLFLFIDTFCLGTDNLLFTLKRFDVSLSDII